MLTMTGLAKSYRTDTVETTALDNVDLDIADGEFVAIMGPSGCGKSTLLNVMGMLDSPTGGSYMFNGREVSCLSESQLAETRKSNIGFIFQSFNLVDELTVRENVELALLYHDHSSGERRARVDRVLDQRQVVDLVQPVRPVDRRVVRERLVAPGAHARMVRWTGVVVRHGTGSDRGDGAAGTRVIGCGAGRRDDTNPPHAGCCAPGFRGAVEVRGMKEEPGCTAPGVRREGAALA